MRMEVRCVSISAQCISESVTEEIKNYSPNILIFPPSSRVSHRSASHRDSSFPTHKYSVHPGFWKHNTTPRGIFFWRRMSEMERIYCYLLLCLFSTLVFLLHPQWCGAMQKKSLNALEISGDFSIGFSNFRPIERLSIILFHLQPIPKVTADIAETWINLQRTARDGKFNYFLYLVLN